ncbi:MAG: phosphogluconate dehydratase [Rhodoferax sp.]
MKLHDRVHAVTQRIRDRSQTTRREYLDQLDAMLQRTPGVQRLGCANVAHAVAALPSAQKLRVVAQRAPNLAIVTAYNDMLSAHAPFQHYPALIRDEAARWGASAQVAGGVPAMCDGVTQGTPAMELSLFSRDVIAMGTAIALSHDVFDGALMLGVCDKIVPGLLVGALHFGHLPTVFVPAGPMTSGLSNGEKSRVREQAAQGRVGRAELLAAESAAYHGPGTCTFYGTANSNQMLLEAMGLHVPGTAFVNPQQPLREALTREAVRTVLGQKGADCPPIGRVVDERCIVNAMVALLATGGSTNHLIHWVAVARAAGLVIDWDDFAALSDCVPLLTRVYPNGDADVNQFQAAGGPGFVIRELLDAGLMHADVLTVHPEGLRAYTQVPQADDGPTGLRWQPVGDSKNESVCRSVDKAFSPFGGLKLLQGNLGRSVIKISAVSQDRWLIEAPCRLFDSQEALLAAFDAGELDQDVVCVVRWQGPQANGMPELHKLTPVLAVLQGRGLRVALVTDGRMSGASGKVPAAIHVTPEAACGGPLARLRDGDWIRLDANAGVLEVQVPETEWAAREPQPMPQALVQANAQGFGRGLLAPLRRLVGSAEQGATLLA